MLIQSGILIIRRDQDTDKHRGKTLKKREVATYKTRGVVSRETSPADTLITDAQSPKI
jgi:hypothetical protein